MTLTTAASLLAAALTVLGVFLRLVVYRRARIEARRELQLEQAEASAKAARKAKEIADDVARVSDDDLRRRLDKFVRDDRR
jgi:hypothetical protein